MHTPQRTISAEIRSWHLYNGDGTLYERRDYQTMRAVTYAYDHQGRCVKATERYFTDANGFARYTSTRYGFRYEYDLNNNLSKLVHEIAGATWETVYTYDNDNRPKTVTFASGKILTNTYDGMGRVTQKRLGLSSNYDTTLSYVAGANSSKTALLSTYKNGSDTAYAYAYDDNGNITSITRGSTSVTYQYNGANELIRENNGFTNQTVTYEYDSWGNIQNKKIYAYTTATNPGTPLQTIPYSYTNSTWGDQMTQYNGQTISYDNMGNPTSYRGKTLTWNGKELTGVTGTASYTYDMNGLRTTKTVGGTTTNYFYNNTVLMGLTTGTTYLLFSYDAAGLVQAVNYNGTYYYYLRNGQGDIVKLIDGSGNTVVEYSYDSWGKPLSCTGTLATTLGTLNPFRYRGYVYDEETQWYYLKSRYYDPETCRFISADVYLSTGQGVLGHNSYAYCRNNPVSRKDLRGLEDEETNTDWPTFIPCDDEGINCAGYALMYIYDAVGVAFDVESNGKIFLDYTYFGSPDPPSMKVMAKRLVDKINVLSDYGVSAEIIKYSSKTEIKKNQLLIAMRGQFIGTDTFHVAIRLGNGVWADKRGETPAEQGRIKDKGWWYFFYNRKKYYILVTIDNYAVSPTSER